jgi:hypothetical protein
MIWTGHAAHMRKKCHIGFCEKTWRKEADGKSTCRWQDDIKMGVGEVDGKGMTGFIWLRIYTNGGLLLTW